MNCPICSQATVVLRKDAGERRRACTGCKHRFTTVEVLKEEHQRRGQLLEDARELAERLVSEGA